MKTHKIISFVPKIEAKFQEVNIYGIGIQAILVICPYCNNIHRHGGFGIRAANCNRGEYELIEVKK